MTLIYLVRHAQADHDGATDFQRVLSAKGVEQSVKLGNWLRSKDLVPKVVIVSSSVRTCQTLVHMAINSREMISDDAYNASENQLLEVLRDSPAGVESTMLIAHNPGISILAMSCGYEHELRTGELVVVEFEGEISDLDPHQAKVLHHHHPDA